MMEFFSLHNRLEDMQRAMVDTDYQKELMKEYGIGK